LSNSLKNQLTIAELYTAAPSAAMTTADAVAAPDGLSTLAEQEQCFPLSSLETGGNEAAGSPAASVAPAAAEKGALSSPEDDSSIDKGDERTVSVELPVDNSLPPWQKFD
jgi:hypothetical protein